MITVQGPGRIKKMCAKINGQIIDKVPDLRCVRKHMKTQKEWNTIRKIKYLFAFVSSPHIYKQAEMLSLVKG